MFAGNSNDNQHCYRSLAHVAEYSENCLSMKVLALLFSIELFALFLLAGSIGLFFMGTSLTVATAVLSGATYLMEICEFRFGFCGEINGWDAVIIGLAMILFAIFVTCKTLF